jgi:hypothetical protein
MTITPRGKSGPPKRFSRPSIDAPLTEAQDDGLTALADATGATKASLVRVAIARLLASAGLTGDEEQSVTHSRISRATTTHARTQGRTRAT